jgi:prepilin-type N-terminal cleavage/methylation domain-containing protein
MRPIGPSRFVRRATGFTLVEMIVVMLIISVLTALAVNVSDDVRRQSRAADTRRIQAVALAALEVYQKNQGALPPGDFGPESGADLLAAMQRCEASQKALQMLPAHAMNRRDPQTGRRLLLDGFARPMRYQHLPGKMPPRVPLLLSQGDDPAEKSDDILLELFLEPPPQETSSEEQPKEPS